MLSLALQALGGAQSWHQITEADAEGTTALKDGQPEPFHWRDNWASKGHMERSGPDTHGKQRHFVADEGEQATLQGPRGNLPKPTFDRISQLMIHLPGAALDLGLSDPRYGVEFAKSSSQLSPATCVSIYHDRINIAHGGLQAIICFNKQTSLPKRATMMLPNLAQPGTTVSEKVQYKSFQQMGSIFCPQTVEVTNPVGIRRLYTFTSIRTNVSSSNAGEQ